MALHRGKLIIVVVVFVLTLTVCFGWAGYYLHRSYRVTNWPMAQGKIEDVRLDHDIENAMLTYRVEATYSYVINGTVYRGNVIAPDYVASADEAFHRRLFGKLKQLESCSVRYNPDNLEDSSLTQSFCAQGYFGATLGVALATIVPFVAFLASFYRPQYEKMLRDRNQATPTLSVYRFNYIWVALGLIVAAILPFVLALCLIARSANQGILESIQ